MKHSMLTYNRGHVSHANFIYQMSLKYTLLHLDVKSSSHGFAYAGFQCRGQCNSSLACRLPSGQILRPKICERARCQEEGADLASGASKVKIRRLMSGRKLTTSHNRVTQKYQCFPTLPVHNVHFVKYDGPGV